MDDQNASAIRCPACGAGYGSPISVLVNRGERTITYRCDQCQHVWLETREHVDPLRLP